MTDGLHRLILAELRLAWAGAHRMLLVVGPDRRVLRQFNGLATGSRGPIPIGWLPRHRLVAYDSDARPGYWLLPAGARWQLAPDGPVHFPDGRAWMVLDDPADGSPGCRAATLKAGSADALAPVLAAMAAAREALNERSLHYPFLGLGANSNSVATTLLRAGALPDPVIPAGAVLVPGWGRVLLPPARLREIQRNAGLAVS